MVVVVVAGGGWGGGMMVAVLMGTEDKGRNPPPLLLPDLLIPAPYPEGKNKTTATKNSFLLIISVSEHRSAPVGTTDGRA